MLTGKSSRGITIEKVNFSYHRHRQLTNINLHIKNNSFCAITGINGSGKSTLTLLLNGLIPHEIKGHLTGNIMIDGLNTKKTTISNLSKLIGMVFQNPDFMLFNLTVREEIEFGLKNFKLDNQQQRIYEALNQVGMTKFINHDPQTLSFGQKQKISLACVLSLDTPYIILDEPTAMLDYSSSCALYAILHSLHQQGKTIIVVEHDTDMISKYADQMIILHQGQIIKQGSPKTVLSNIELLKKIGIKTPNK